MILQDLQDLQDLQCSHGVIGSRDRFITRKGVLVRIQVGVYNAGIGKLA